MTGLDWDAAGVREGNTDRHRLDEIFTLARGELTTQVYET